MPMLKGWLDRTRPILANGFKIPPYAGALLRLRADGFQNLLPIFDDLEELESFAAAGLPLRSVCARARSQSSLIALAWTPRLCAMLPSALWPLHSAPDDLPCHADRLSGARLSYQNGLIHSLRGYAALWRHAPTLHRFNFGGGLPCAPQRHELRGVDAPDARHYHGSLRRRRRACA